MEILDRAGTAWPTMRALSPLAMPSSAWRLASTPARPRTATTHLNTRSGYGLGSWLTCPVHAAEVDHAVDVIKGMGADATFTTRLGPTASPPV